MGRKSSDKLVKMNKDIRKTKNFSYIVSPIERTLEISLKKYGITLGKPKEPSVSSIEPNKGGGYDEMKEWDGSEGWIYDCTDGPIVKRCAWVGKKGKEHSEDFSYWRFIDTEFLQKVPDKDYNNKNIIKWASDAKRYSDLVDLSVGNSSLMADYDKGGKLAYIDATNLSEEDCFFLADLINQKFDLKFSGKSINLLKRDLSGLFRAYKLENRVEDFFNAIILGRKIMLGSS